tara:strand:+ start:187 stop:441 length:255 start_codon:yes stop_codon:yes gene_type:complete
MKTLLNKFTDIKNWIGKTVLWLIGIIMIAGQNYALVLSGFLLTDKEVHFSLTIYTVVSSFGLLFIVGGIYLNKFLEKFTGIKDE